MHDMSLCPPSYNFRYSLAGQDTRLSPERPGFESRWRNLCMVAVAVALIALMPMSRMQERAERPPWICPRLRPSPGTGPPLLCGWQQCGQLVSGLACALCRDPGDRGICACTIIAPCCQAMAGTSERAWSSTCSLAAWSSGMILAQGARGPGFNSRSSPFATAFMAATASLAQLAWHALRKRMITGAIPRVGFFFAIGCVHLSLARFTAH